MKLSPGRSRRRTLAAVTLLAGLLAGVTGAAAVPGIKLEKLPGTDRLDRSLGLVHAGDGSGRVFIVLQNGRVFIHDGTKLTDRPFLDISGRVNCCSAERGLVGMAFHPDYADNGEFFVSYVAKNGDGVVSRFRVSNDPDRANAGSEREILRVEQPFDNHNVNQLVFGPDGMLYVGSGDGGSAGDPNDNGQNLSTLLGKILRIDVDRGNPYAIPPDNPFVGEPGARDEIWAWGVRNPWRFTFDRRTGDLYMGDVGQDDREEVNFEPAGSSGGRNYGWRTMEGSLCFNPPTGCDPAGLTLPILEYDHDVGCSVTGGYRYRGPAAPTLPRFYFYGDFCFGKIWGALRNGAGNWQSNLLLDTNLRLTSFGEDEAGNLYVVHFQGAVYRVVGRNLFASDFESGRTRDWSRRVGGLATAAPGLRGSAHALEVPVDGTATARFLRSLQPTGETTFAAGFDLNPNRVGLAGEEIEIFRADGDATLLALKLAKRGPRYRVNLYARENGGELRFVGQAKIKKQRTVTVAIEWTQATSAEAADGEAILTINGKVKAAAFDLDNAGARVEETRIGLPAGAAGTGGGAFLIDNYFSTP